MDKKTALEKLVREAHEKGLFTGTWLYAEHGEIISKGAVGFRDAEDRLPMREDSIFELASITKQFTAAAVMLLIREGKLRLEDEITDYFPEIPYKGATIRNLLNHTAGLPDIYDSDWIVKVWEEEKKIPSNGIVLRYLTESGEGPRFAPGEKYEYSNTGYNLLAETVEKVSGLPFEEFLKKKLFEPAGMHDTAVCHVRRDGFPSDAFVRNLVREDGRLILPDVSKDDYDVAAVDGLNGDDYVYTNIFDMLIWDKALREEKLLTREEQRMMYTPGRLNNGEVSGAEEDADGYGFGWEIINDPELGLIVCHSGGMPGLSTWFERFLDADRVLVFLCCRAPADKKGYEAFFAGMRAIARGKEPKPILTTEELAVRDPDKSEWESFCGKYDFADGSFRIDEIVLRDGTLYMKAFDDDESLEFRMYPLGDKTFCFKEFYSDLRFGEGSLTLWGVTGKKL